MGESNLWTSDEEDTVWPFLVAPETHTSTQGNCRKCEPWLTKLLIKCCE